MSGGRRAGRTASRRDPFDVPPVAPWKAPEVLYRIPALLAEGAEVCVCQPRPVDWIDDGGVMVCPWCSGVERGQIDDAEGLAR